MSSYLFPLERILTTSTSLRQLNRPERSRSSRDFPDQLDDVFHGRKDRNARETDLVWPLDYLDEVCNKRSLFSSLSSTQGSFSDPLSDMFGNHLSKLRELGRLLLPLLCSTPPRFSKICELVTERSQRRNALHYHPPTHHFRSNALVTGTRQIMSRPNTQAALSSSEFLSPNIPPAATVVVSCLTLRVASSTSTHDPPRGRIRRFPLTR